VSKTIETERANAHTQLGRDYGALLRRLPLALALSCRQVLHIVLVRYVVAFCRYALFVWVLRRLRFFTPSGGAVAEMTVKHNYKGMLDLAVARSLVLIRPLTAVDRVTHTMDTAQVLCVGPRTEGELLNLWAHGFHWDAIRGLDLISYSPRIDLGDMHEMPYPSDRWDVILLGWVMAYSNDPPLAAHEVVRVAKHGAVIAVGIEYNPLSIAAIKEKIGYVAGAGRSYGSVDEILSWFGNAVDRVYFRQDIERDFLDRVGAITVVFSVKK
jgi:hypothetical protein